jgi:hypothetical protein
MCTMDKGNFMVLPQKRGATQEILGSPMGIIIDRANLCVALLESGTIGSPDKG